MREFNMPGDDEIYPKNSNTLLYQIKRVCKAMGVPWDGLEPPWIIQIVKYTHPIGLSFSSYHGVSDIRITSRPPPFASNARRLLHMDGLYLEASREQLERALYHADATDSLDDGAHLGIVPDGRGEGDAHRRRC